MMNRWRVERGQSLVYMDDTYGVLGNEEAQVEYYQKTFNLEPTGRESLMRSAEFYYRKNDPLRVACYCSALLRIPGSDFYANFQPNYEHLPHELLYWAFWQLGDK